MNLFLSCDWGTSAFRLSLAATPGSRVIAAHSSGQGILQTYNNWKNAGAGEEGRMAFYLAIIQENIKVLQAQVGESLQGLPVLISGMASSSVGMKPVPYQQIPFAVDGSGALAEYFPAGGDFNHEVLLISGVQSEDDVMRGEETQLIGCIPAEFDPSTEQLFIFPGTHSKHITVINGRATSFKTYMTGEFFDLLSTKSILAAGLSREETTDNSKVFAKGVAASRDANLLNASFTTRTNHLFGLLSPAENYQYLSGLLIGTELQHLAGTEPKHIYLCSGSTLKPLYEAALATIGLAGFHSLPSETVEMAVMKGQYRIYEKFKTHA